MSQGRQGGRDLKQMREKALWLPGEMVSGSGNSSVNSRTERHLRELFGGVLGLRWSPSKGLGEWDKMPCRPNLVHTFPPFP